MRSEGHVGLTLAAMSAIAWVLAYPLSKSFLLIFLTAAFSSLPDVDLRMHGLVKHRSQLTHSLFGAIVFGLAFGVLFGYAGIGFWIGFTSAFAGVCFHLLGDLMTFMKLQPFWPFSRRRMALGIFRSSNSVVNWSFVLAGFLMFLFYVLHAEYLLYL